MCAHPYSARGFDPDKPVIKHNRDMNDLKTVINKHFPQIDQTPVLTEKCTYSVSEFWLHSYYFIKAYFVFR